MKGIREILLCVLLSLGVPMGASAEQAEEAVNINTADQAALAEGIKGVGERKAAAILLYREKHGPFESVEDLANVKGISASIIEKNRDMLTVE